MSRDIQLGTISDRKIKGRIRKKNKTTKNGGKQNDNEKADGLLHGMQKRYCIYVAKTKYQ